MTMPCFDINAYQPITNHDSLSDFINLFQEDGLHEVNETGNPWHIYTQDALKHPDYILVGFSGRVTLDGIKRPPYFSFRGVADRTGLGLIAFSDPSQNFSKDLSLCWYVGNGVDGNIIDKLVGVLDGIIERTGRRLLLAGGSGGGFAALNVHSKMRFSDRVKSFAWNPQTDITKYNNKVLVDYFSACFKEDKSISSIEKFFQDNRYSYLLEKREDLEQLIFINGYDPSHLRKHVRRFFPKKLDDKNSVAVGDWGMGHVPPQPNIIVDVIKRIANGESIKEIPKSLPESRKKLLDFSKNKTQFLEVLDFRVAVVKISDGRIVTIRSNIYEYYYGFQVRIKLKAGGVELFDSGYLLGQDMSEVYIEVKNENLKKINLSDVVMIFEDYLGCAHVIDIPFARNRKLLVSKSIKYGV